MSDWVLRESTFEQMTAEDFEASIRLVSVTTFPAAGHGA
jgi:hypothetical protein